MTTENRVTPAIVTVVLVIAAVAAIGGVSYYFWAEDILGEGGWPAALSLGIMCLLAIWAGRFQVGSTQMIPPNKSTIASLIVGLSGGIIGGYWGYELWQTPEISGAFIQLPLGAVSGFLSCFFVSEWYLKAMAEEGWERGILFGPFFGGLAGAISGVITGLSGAIGGLLFGGLTGLAVGLISSLIFGATRAISTNRKGGLLLALTLPPCLVITVILGVAYSPESPSAGDYRIVIGCDWLQQNPNDEGISKLVPGQSFSISACSDPATGFQWLKEAQISDTTVLQQKAHEFREPESYLPPGTPGWENWEFQAIKEGTTEIYLEYSQPWEGGEKAKWTIRQTVIVE